MTPRPVEYEDGDVLEYRHRGQAYVGTLEKAQRRHALIRAPSGRLLAVPWTAVDGVAARKAKGQVQP